MQRATLVLPLILLSAACGTEPAPDPPKPRDPAIEQALGDPLMTDPDLASRNEGAAALTVAVDGPLPILRASEEERAHARAAAGVLVGGAERLTPAPEPSGEAASLPETHGPAQHLAVLVDKSACRAALTATTAWAARLPAALPVYPRGATQSAIGGEGRGCRVAAVVFTTPVPPADVLAFYWRRALDARLSPRRRQAGESAVIEGGATGTAFDLRARAIEGGTLVELASVTG